VVLAVYQILDNPIIMKKEEIEKDIMNHLYHRFFQWSLRNG
jgi:hypothetical protein